MHAQATARNGAKPQLKTMTVEERRAYIKKRDQGRERKPDPRTTSKYRNKKLQKKKPKKKQNKKGKN